jgi:glutaconate CoA-transferase subunit A
MKEAVSLDKIKNLQDVVQSIPSGSHITFSGFGHTLTPMAVVREIIRQGKKNFTMTGISECWAADMLIGAGAIDKLYFSNFMFEGYGRCRNFSRAIEEETIKVEDYSHYALASRFAAGAIGVPYLPIKSMLGSDILEIGFDDNKYKVDHCPYTDEKIVLVPAVRPDFAIIHGHRADAKGNVQIIGAKAIIEEQVRAAKNVIVTVEKIVDSELIRSNPEFTIIPGFLVSALVEVPYGAHPTGMYRMYDFDSSHIEKYIESSRNRETFEQYLHAYASGSHEDYLEKIGISKLLDLKTDPFLGYRDPDKIGVSAV